MISNKKVKIVKEIKKTLKALKKWRKIREKTKGIENLNQNKRHSRLQIKDTVLETLQLGSDKEIAKKLFNENLQKNSRLYNLWFFI